MDKKDKSPRSLDEPLPNPTDCLYYLISRATLMATAALKRGFSAAGFERVRPAYIGVLMCLWKRDGQKVAELGRGAGLEPSTMTGLLDRMERDQMVERRADPNDRRAQHVFLTGEGRAARRAVLEVVERTLARATSGIDEDKLTSAKEVLRMVLARAQDKGEAAADPVAPDPAARTNTTSSS